MPRDDPVLEIPASPSAAVTERPPHPAPWWRRHGLLLNLAFLVLFALVLRRFGWLSLQAVATWRGAALLGTAVLVKVTAEVLGGLAWQRLALLQGISLSWKTAVLAAMSAQYLARVTPSRVGEFIRVSYLMHESGRSVGLALSSVMAERVVSRIASLLYQLVGSVAFLLTLSGRLELPPLAVIGLFVVALLLAVVTVVVHLWRPLHERLVGVVGRVRFLRRYSDQFRETVVHYHAGLQAFRQRAVWLAVLLAFLVHPFNYLSLYCVFTAFDIPIPFWHFLQCYFVAHLLSRLGRLSFMGVGTTEAITAFLLDRLAYPAWPVLTVALGGYFVTHIVVPILGLGTWLAWPVPLSGRRVEPAVG